MPFALIAYILCIKLIIMVAFVLRRRFGVVEEKMGFQYAIRDASKVMWPTRNTLMPPIITLDCYAR